MNHVLTASEREENNEIIQNQEEFSKVLKPNAWLASKSEFVKKPEVNNREQTKPATIKTMWSSRLDKIERELIDRQRGVERDQELRERWLTDNVNDLHRELKQTESEFEHYFQVTKELIARNEARINQQQQVIIKQQQQELARMNMNPIPIVYPIQPISMQPINGNDENDRFFARSWFTKFIATIMQHR